MRMNNALQRAQFSHQKSKNSRSWACSRTFLCAHQPKLSYIVPLKKVRNSNFQMLISRTGCTLGILTLRTSVQATHTQLLTSRIFDIYFFHWKMRVKLCPKRCEKKCVNFLSVMKSRTFFRATFFQWKHAPYNNPYITRTWHVHLLQARIIFAPWKCRVKKLPRDPRTFSRTFCNSQWNLRKKCANTFYVVLRCKNCAGHSSMSPIVIIKVYIMVMCIWELHS